MSNQPTYYPLTAAQDMMVFNQKFSLRKAIVNICVMEHFDFEVDEARMLEAVKMALSRNQSSSVRLHKIKGKVQQYLSDEAPAPIPVLDYRSSTDEALDHDIRKWSKTPFPNGSMDTQLYIVRMIWKPNGRLGIYFCVSHFAFDAYALLEMAKDMLQIYNALGDGTPIPEAKGDYLKMCQGDWDYNRSEKRTQDLKFWYDVYDTEPLFSAIEPLKMKRLKGTRQGRVVNLIHSKAYHVNLPLDAELVSAVNDLAEKYRVSPQCCYLLAVRSYLSAVNDDQDDILVGNTVSRRSTLLQKRSGGTLVMALTFRMHFDNKKMTVAEGLQEISKLQMKYYAHANICIMDVIDKLFRKKFGTKPMYGYHSISMTYNPYVMPEMKAISGHITTYPNGASALPVYLSIMAMDDSGALNCNYECMECFTTKETAHRVHAHLVRALRAMVEDPEQTLLSLNHVKSAE